MASGEESLRARGAPPPGKDEGEGEGPEAAGTRATVALFVALVVSIKSTVGALLLISSQLVYEGPYKEWFFFGVTAMPSVAATAVGLVATGSDKYYDLRFGVAAAVHFRIVGASILLCTCVVTLALMPQGSVQVGLAFVVCLLAEAVVYASVQFVAVLDPALTSWVSLAGVLSYLVP